MAPPLTAQEWLVLDNLHGGWPYLTNLARVAAGEAYRSCEAKGYILAGQLTPEGKAARLARRTP